jgi:hypothetical protein
MGAGLASPVVPSGNVSPCHETRSHNRALRAARANPRLSCYADAGLRLRVQAAFGQGDPSYNGTGPPPAFQKHTL